MGNRTKADKKAAAELKEAPPAGFYSAGNLQSIVNNCVRGGSFSKQSRFPAKRVIESIKRGLPIAELNALQDTLQVPIDQLASRLGISRATLHRRKTEGRLDSEESDRVVRFAKLFGKAIEALETEDNARRWLCSEQVGLGGAIPLDYAETEVGAREVEDLLARIEYSVYS
jgi:putative toxin-antitoxin system antitoxin component (TIGR02293 family)